MIQKKEKTPKSKLEPMRVMKYFWRISMQQKWYFWTIFFCRVLTVILATSVPLYYKQIIDIIGTYTWWAKWAFVDQLLGVLVIAMMIEITSQLTWRVIEYCIVQLQPNSMRRIYQECFEYLHKHSYGFFTDNFVWSLVKKVNKLVFSYEWFTDAILFNLMWPIISLLLVIPIIYTENIQLWIIFTVRLVVYCAMQYRLQKRKLPSEIFASEERSRLTWALSDSIGNNFTISSFGAYRYENSRFKKSVLEVVAATKVSRKKSNIIHAINWTSMVVVHMGLLYSTIIFWGQDLITIWTIVLLQMYTFRIFDQLFNIWNTFKRIYQMISESAEMIDILHTPHAIKDTSTKELKLTAGRIEIKDMTFGYKKPKPLFKDFSLSIKAWEKVAFVGHSGSGKTSLVRLLFRFFDIQKGEILFDGQNIAHVTQESLRQSISLVPQEPLLFHRSIKENIAYGKPDASDEEILHASKLAHCHEFVKDLESGYDTLVWERWVKLSGWQRQRIAIARAMLENKHILVLDEATSSLDSESEHFIQQAMHKVLENKTAIVVAHRLSTVMEMDRIVVMDNGRIIEQGTHEELLQKEDGQYKKLRSLQWGSFLWE